MKRDDVKNLVGVGKVFVLLPVALASVTLAVAVGLSNKGWTRLQTRLYASRRRHASTSTPPSTTYTTPFDAAGRDEDILHRSTARHSDSLIAPCRCSRKH